MSRTNQVVNLLAVGDPADRLPPDRRCSSGTSSIGPTDIVVMVVMYLLTGFGITVGFHRLFTHRSFATKRWLEYTFAGAGPDGGPGAGGPLGRRPSQAPRALRRGGRPALAAPRRRRRHGRAARALPRARRLAVQRAGARRPQEVREGPHGRPGPQADLEGASRWFVLLDAAGPGGDRLRDRGDGGRRARRLRLGRPRAHVLPAPRDVEHQLGVPLHGPPAVRRRGRVAQRVLAGAAVARRGVAPQPPRVPALGDARPEALGARSVRAAHPRAAAARARVERRRDQRRPSGAEAQGRGGAGRRARRPDPAGRDEGARGPTSGARSDERR